jgi:hypothetical protein
MWEKIRNWLNSLFSESKEVSMLRVLSVITILDILSMWTYACIKSSKIEDFPTNVVLIFVTVIGGKVLQKIQEVKSTS